MPVYVDQLANHGGSATFRWKHSCHMFADTDEELHALAARIGLKRAWFQKDDRLPHYDLNESRRIAAVKAGVIEVTWREMWAMMQKNMAKNALETVEAAIGPVSAKYQVKPEHWIQGWDEGFSFCADCGKLEVMRFQAAAFFGLTDDNPDNFRLGGGYPLASDGEAFCEVCNHPLNVLFTEDACVTLLDHWAETPFNAQDPGDCWCLDRVLMAMAYDDNDEQSKRLRTLVKSIARQIKKAA